MVSLQAALSPRVRTAGSSSGAFLSSMPEFTEPSKKRKCGEEGGLWDEAAESLSAGAAGSRNGASKQVAVGGSFLELLMRSKSRRQAAVEEYTVDQEETSRVPHPLLDVELHLGDRPMVPEGRRVHDARSGSTHFVNSRTNSWAWKDQRRSPPSPQKPIDFDCPSPAGIDLELNLSCDSSSSAGSQREGDLSGCQHTAKNKNKITSQTNKSTASRVAEVAAPTPAPAEPAESSPEEMVAAVCARCHMLIMMRRTSPSCPNCKYLHPPPPEQQQLHGGRSFVRPTTGLNQLLCCKD